MKKAIVVIIIIGALAALYWFNKESGTVVKSPDGTQTEQTSTKPDPSNATFVFDEESVTLSNGKSVTDTEETNLLDLKAYGDLNGDKKNDTVVLATRYGGGSGLFIYIAGYVSTSSSYRGTNAIFLGDRIIPESVTINSSGFVTVNYLDRSEDEPFSAEPTVSTSKQFVYKSGELMER
jgi:hypothetical protein